MHTLVNRSRFDVNIDSASVFLGNNINISRCIPAGQFAVGAEIIGSCRNFMKIRNLTDQAFLYLIKLYHIFTTSFQSAAGILRR